MNASLNTCCTVDIFEKPDNVSEQEWYAIDMSDPLMAVC